MTQSELGFEHHAMAGIEPALDKSQLAEILAVPTTWVQSHAGSIPGMFRLGRHVRFRRSAMEEWLGGSMRLLKPEEVAAVLQVNTSWIYAHAEQIPGILRLGYYIRFKPSMLLAFLNEKSCQ